MFFSKIKRSFDKTLSEGQGLQLLWLLVAIAIVVLVFWAIVVLVFRDGSLQWQDLLALFLDPGCFGGAGSHDLFRLIATLFGMFLFSALLISVVSNMFENIAESFRHGLSRYSYKNHVLILGGGYQLVSMLYALLEDEGPYKDSKIVVLTTQNVVKLRGRILSIFDGERGKELRDRLTFYYGERDNENNLSDRNLAKNARVIYIIGEDGEHDHDSLSVRCCMKLKSLCKNGARVIPCFLVLQDTSSLHVYKHITDAETDKDSSLKVDVVDANEYIAEQVLVADHDGIDVVMYPGIDYREVKREADGSFTTVSGILEDTDKFVHFVVVGSTQMARSMALTAAHICHFPNFKNGKNRTVITFVDTDMRAKMDAFLSTYANLFKLSHYSFTSFPDGGHPSTAVFVPDPAFGDFIDVEWQFVDADICAPGMRRLLNSWIADSRRSVSIAICRGSQDNNAFAALNFPDEVYNSGCPIFVHQQECGDILSQAMRTRRFGNIHIFGMASSIQDDPLFLCRSKNGRMVNYYYYHENGDTPVSRWYNIPEAHKFSSIYCANALRIRAHSFGLGTIDFSSLPDEQKALLYEVEHRRWMMSSLLLGYRALDLDTRKEWKGRMLHEDNNVKDAARSEFKVLKKRFYHMDITPYYDLLPEEQEKDRIILENYSVIMK